MLNLSLEGIQKKDKDLLSYLRAIISQKKLDNVYENIEFPLELAIISDINSKIEDSIISNYIKK